MSRRYRLSNHALFWVVFLTTALSYNTITHNNGVFTLGLFWEEFGRWDTYAEYSRVALTFYLSLWVFTHRFYPKYFPVIFLQIIALGTFDAFLSYLMYQKAIPLVHGAWQRPPPASLIYYLTDNLLSGLVYVFLALLFKQGQDYFKNEALVQEKNAIELAYLKSQLNPHFLFNTLNNLYGLALTEPGRTPDAILKLADLMRYMLYESNESYVALAQELNYLTSYVALEKLRHEGEVYVDFSVEGPVANWQIAPLLLISFVENAFKHGSLRNAAQPIRLQLSVDDQRLTFLAENQVVHKNKDLVGGVGLASVRRRLALLYPNSHQLTIAQHGDLFRCVLVLNTASTGAHAGAAVSPALPVAYFTPAARPL